MSLWYAILEIGEELFFKVYFWQLVFPNIQQKKKQRDSRIVPDMALIDLVEIAVSESNFCGFIVYSDDIVPADKWICQLLVISRFFLNCSF